MTEVELFIKEKAYLTRTDIQKIFPIDFRNFEERYATAFRVNDKRISKFKIDIITIPGNKRDKKLFKTTDVVEFLKLHGVALRRELKKPCKYQLQGSNELV